ncbi:MAG TPA: AI-2E family transporter [Mucilaginibacter sp.]|nr:AI-2E family transporter [Mucilaginibacter sp.]
MKKEITYTLRVWQTVAIVALLVAIILIVRVAFNVLLMALAGALIAVYFHGLGDLIQRKTRLSRKLAMILSIVGSFIIIGGLFWFIGAKIQAQVAELSNTLPHTVSTAKAKLTETPIGQKILEYTSGDNSKKLLDTATSFFNTSFGVLGDLYIILFLGIFFTANPSLYKDGILMLIPEEKKELGKCIIDRISLSLKGMMVSMVLVTILITVGLTIVGLPAAMILGLITGILEIIPNLGSLIAMIPGVLLSLTVSTNTAIVVALIYIVSQTIVANIVTPLIQKKMINLPPALTLISQLIMGTVSGALGIILAVPLLAILIIMVDELYVKKINIGKAVVVDKGLDK